MLHLNEVTLIGIDGVSFGRLALAFDISAHGCRFAAQKILTPFDVCDPRAVRVPQFTYEDYSRFVLHELHKHVDTPYALLVQYDGFVLEPRAWCPDFLEYDYVGAAWRPPMKGGVGGFSLRSKRFLEATSQVVPRTARGNEDRLVCHDFVEDLERAGIRLAPLDVCRRFAFDATGTDERRTKWSGEFGFHNLANTDLSEWHMPDLRGLDASCLARTVLELGGLLWRREVELRRLRAVEGCERADVVHRAHAGAGGERRACRSWRVVIQEVGRVATQRRIKAEGAVAFARKEARRRRGALPILVSSPLAMGDALMLASAIAALHEKLPRAPIHVLTGPRGALMFEHNPAVAVIISGPLRDRATVSAIEESYVHVYRTGPWLTKKPDSLSHNGYELAHRELCVEQRAPRPAFYGSPEEQARVERELRKAGIQLGHDTLALIHPQASSPMRRWPLEHAWSLAKTLSAKGHKVIVAGRGLLAEDPALDQDGVLFSERELRALTTRETFLLTRHASYVVAVDSVYSHLAACFGKPAILLYGSFRPELLAAPLLDRAVVLQHDLRCGPCHNHRGRCSMDPGGVSAPCMTAIRPAEVLKAVEQLLDPGKATKQANHVTRAVELPIACAVCESSELRPFARKGEIIYGKCCACGSVCRPCVIPPERLFAAGGGFWSLCELSRNECWVRQTLDHAVETLEALIDPEITRSVLTFGRERTGGLERALRARGWHLENVDPETAAPFGPRHPSAAGGHAALVVGAEVMRIPRLSGLWHFSSRVLRPGGLTLVLCQVSDHHPVKEAAPYNTPIAGENVVVPSTAGLQQSARRAGFVVAACSRLRETKWHLTVLRSPAREMSGAAERLNLASEVLCLP